MTAELFAPEHYWQLRPEVRASMVNGCGPGGWKAGLVPDTLYGLSITESCNIHDYMYLCGLSIEDKRQADRVFLNNMLRQIAAAGGWSILQTLRRRRAKTYYSAVKHFGGPFFWHGKNSPGELGLVAA